MKFLLVILLASACFAATVEDLMYEAQLDNQRESEVRNLVASIPEDQRAAMGAQQYVKYSHDKTSLSFIRAGDKIFIKHPQQGKFFMKTSDFWNSNLNTEAVITLQERCPFPPSIPPKTAECPNGAATCPPKEEAKCDKHLADMKKFANEGLLTKKKFDCLEKYLKPVKPSLSYFCVINGVRQFVKNTEPASPPTSQPTPSYTAPQNQRPVRPATMSRTSRRGTLGL